MFWVILLANELLYCPGDAPGDLKAVSTLAGEQPKRHVSGIRFLADGELLPFKYKTRQTSVIDVEVVFDSDGYRETEKTLRQHSGHWEVERLLTKAKDAIAVRDEAFCQLICVLIFVKLCLGRLYRRCDANFVKRYLVSFTRADGSVADFVVKLADRKNLHRWYCFIAPIEGSLEDYCQITEPARKDFRSLRCINGFFRDVYYSCAEGRFYFAPEKALEGERLELSLNTLNSIIEQLILRKPSGSD